MLITSQTLVDYSEQERVSGSVCRVGLGFISLTMLEVFMHYTEFALHDCLISYELWGVCVSCDADTLCVYGEEAA